MAVELYKAPLSGDRLSYRLFIDGVPVEFEQLRGAKRLLADALLGLAVSDHERRKSLNVVDPDQIPGSSKSADRERLINDPCLSG